MARVLGILRIIMKSIFRLSSVLLAGLLAACAAPQPTFDQLKDGYPAKRVDMTAAPSLTPIHEPRTRAGNKSPYTVKGKTYRIRDGVDGYREQGYASWYGTKFHGRRTANGEVYNMYALSGAHKTLPIPSYVQVTNLENGRNIIVRLNDRGPFVDGRVIDLSYTAAQKLGMLESGTARVEVVALNPDDFAGKVASNSYSGANSLPEDASFKLQPTTRLQVGAYGSKQKAAEIQRKLEEIFIYPVAIDPVSSAGKRLYRVRIGPIQRFEHLAEIQNELLARNFGRAQVVHD